MPCGLVLQRVVVRLCSPPGEMEPRCSRRRTQVRCMLWKNDGFRIPHRIVDDIHRDSIVAEGDDTDKPFRAKLESAESTFG